MGKKLKSASTGKSEIEQAIEQLCSNCYDIFSDASGRYAGQLPCYDCIDMLVAVNKRAANKYRRKGGVFELVFFDLIVGIVRDFVMGFANLIDVGLSGGGVRNIAIALFNIVISPISTVMNAINTFRQMKQANVIVASDSQTLKEMQDYLAYTQLMQRQKTNCGTLSENSYEIAVINFGEKSAKSELRGKVNQVFANSETLMSFDNAKTN